MRAKKRDYDDNKNLPKDKLGGPKRVVFDPITGGMMFDTYQSIKDLEKEGKFTEKQAASIVKIVSRGVEHNISNLARKQDVDAVKTDIDGVKKDLLHLEEKMNLRFESIEARMATKEDLAKVHSSLITWLMGMSVTIGGALIVGLYYIIKYLPAIQPVIQNTPN